MSKRLNKLAEIVLDRVYTYGYQQRAAEAEHANTKEELAAAEGGLRIALRDRDHWRDSRQQAIEAGELMRDEIETLRAQLAAAQREASDEFVERQVLQHEASVDIAEVERLRAEVVKLRAFVVKVRNANDATSWYDLETALNELDAATANPATVTEPMDAEGGQ